MVCTLSGNYNRNMKKQVLIFYCFFSIMAVSSAKAQQQEVVKEYISRFKDLAMEEMQRTGVPAAIKLAQGIHETGAGTSQLVLKSNNHFGIKCKSNWTGESVSHDDDERGECFRKYSAAEESYRDHSDFLKNSSRYASLFTLDPTDYKGWANGLKKAGYATNPKYPSVLIKLVEDYQLQDYTLIAMGKKKNPDAGMVSALLLAEQETTFAATPVTEDNAEAAITRVQPSYPEGIFQINETKVVFVKSGTSWLSVAQQYNIPLARIFEFNDMEQSEVAEKDQLVYLQRKRKTGKTDLHIVVAGETLHDIAQQQAIRLEALLEYNKLEPGMQPAIGEKLYLRTQSLSRPRIIPKQNAANNKWSNY